MCDISAKILFFSSFYQRSFNCMLFHFSQEKFVIEKSYSAKLNIQMICNFAFLLAVVVVDCFAV